ncbi:UBN2 domain-containing protein, partial [Cephalotus follicularis]
PLPTIPSSLNSTTTIPNPNYLSWCQRDQLLLSWINASLSESILPLVIGKHTSADTWTTLNQSLGSPTHTRILQLHMQLQNLKKNNSSISTYLQKAKYITDELAAASKVLSPEEFNAIIFNNLGPFFNAIVAAISTRTTPVLLPELHSLLTSEEIRLQHNTPSIDLPYANMVTRNTKPDSHTRSYTSSTNDSSSSRPSNNNSNKNYNNNNRTRNNNNPIKCQICKQNGHLAYRCKYRYH